MPNGWPTMKPVRIRPDLSVDQEDCHLSKSHGDEAVWISEGAPLRVNFDDSPFQVCTFEVPAGGRVSSGPIRADAELRRYAYTITSLAQAGALATADPFIVADP